MLKLRDVKTNYTLVLKEMEVYYKKKEEVKTEEPQDLVYNSDGDNSPVKQA